MWLFIKKHISHYTEINTFKKPNEETLSQTTGSFSFAFLNNLKKNPFKRCSNKLETNSSPSCVHVASYYSSLSSREGK